ncbi:hypothetical protein COBT_001367 [Conglomerata obtusa]
MKYDTGVLLVIGLGIFFALFWGRITQFTFNTNGTAENAGPDPLEVRVANLEILIQLLRNNIRNCTPQENTNDDNENDDTNDDANDDKNDDENITNTGDTNLQQSDEQNIKQRKK